jgi:glycosyltransferase involved in cell wall biosynthesis
LKLMAVVPARNEAVNLPLVIGELRELLAGDAILIVDDGSSDNTTDVARSLGVCWLRLHQHLGLGGALRAGLRWAYELGFEVVVRLDADGQHMASEMPDMVKPLKEDHADATVGSRFQRQSEYRQPPLRKLAGSALARCLSILTGQRVTDPTSGFWAFGPRAVRTLATHHPTGYSEPELMLLLRRNRLRLTEVPVTMRQRLAGRSTLTAPHAARALARAFLAMAVVPLRSTIKDQADD